MDEQQEQKFQQMTTEPVGHLIGRLALPCIISMLVTAFYNMADTFFVGMLKSNSATGAVGVVFSLMAIIQAVGFFFGHGSGNFISRELGKHHYEEASNMAATGFFTALATGALICLLGQIFLEPLAYLLGSTPTILPYATAYLQVILLGAPWMTASLVLNNQLRFQGSAAYAMVGITSGAVLNIGLDPLLIFTFDMGVAGAAWATIISQFISFCLLLAGCTRGGNLRIRISRFQCKWSYFRMIIRGGLPSLARQGLASVATICLNHAAMPYGDAAIAAMGDDSRPFPGCREALAAIHVLTDTAVVSSANSEALAEEWTRHGLVQHMDVVLGQDAGTKEACLSALSAKGYAPGHVLMVGDALGDLAAAQHADALFYPILVGKEKTSWERLVSEALPRFLAGTFAGAYQEQLLAEQREILK